MDLMRLFREKKFYLAILLAFAGILLGTTWPKPLKDGPLESGTCLKLTIEGLKSETVLFLLPIAAVLPWGEAYLAERQWNFLRVLIIRRGKRDYCRDHVLVAALSGALVWGIASLLSLLFFFLLFFVWETPWASLPETLWELLFLLGRICLLSCALASLGGLCGVLSHSLYLALGLPFILYYACIILRDRYLEELYYIDPAEWIAGKQDWGPGQGALWIFLILLALTLALLHRLALEERLEEL